MRGRRDRGGAWCRAEARRVLAPALLVGLAAVVGLLAPAAARAEVRVRSLAVAPNGSLAAVLHDGGLHVKGPSGGWGWVCPSVYSGGRFALVTAAGRLLVTGARGANLGLPTGCSWVRSAGAVVDRPVAGVWAPLPGGDEVVFLATDVLGTASLLESTDGGQTTRASDRLALAEVEVTGMVASAPGEADAPVRVAVVGRRVGDGSGASAWRVWRTVAWGDEGDAFEEVVIAWEGQGALRPAAWSAEGLWLWAGDELALLEPGSADLRIERAFPGAEPALGDTVAVDALGAPWVAAGDEGVLRRVGGAWVPVGAFGVAISVTAAGGVVRVGLEADAYGDPLVLRADAAGTGWEVEATLDDLAAPSGCQALLGQTCRAEREVLDTALRPPEPPVEEPGPVRGGDGCAGGRSPEGLAAALAAFCLARAARRRSLGAPGGRAGEDPYSM